MRALSGIAKKRASVSTTQYDTVVVGAGPYGLSAAAHLLGRGLKVAIFGKPLSLWREHMPQGMYLRSRWWATNLSDPQKKYGFEQFIKMSHYQKCYPVPIQMFIDYGRWFQQHAVPDVDEVYVSSIEHKGDQFLLMLADGRVVQSWTVVMAIGLYYYANRPVEYEDMPAELVSHSVDHYDLSRFAGKQVVVIGGGQSAVEYAALLQEARADVQLVSRRPVHWLDPDRSEGRPFLEQLRAPAAAIAPGWRNWALEYFPYLFYRFPQHKKDNFIRNRSIAAAADWLKDRVIGKDVLHEGQQVQKMKEVDNGVELTLSNNAVLRADHIMFATGYRVNIKRLPMLHQSLLSTIQTDMDAPILNPWFESSVPGLFFIGSTALRSFGPLYRFVAGDKAAAQRVASAVARQAARRKRGEYGIHTPWRI